MVLKMDEKLTFLKTLEEAGVEFCVLLVDGMYNIDAAEVLRYAKDPDQFAAERRGVTVEHWRAWKRWALQGHPCYAITRRGKPCKIENWYVELQDFQPGVSEYCNLHLRQSALHPQGRR